MTEKKDRFGWGNGDVVIVKKKPKSKLKPIDNAGE